MLNSRGSQLLILSLSIATMGALWGIYQYASLEKVKKLAIKNKRDTMQLVSAHGMASILKQELFENFERLKVSSPSCVSNSPGAFLRFLEAPEVVSVGCGNVLFRLSYFRTSTGATAFRAADAKTVRLVPQTSYEPNFDTTLQITSTESNLNRIYGKITMLNRRSLVKQGRAYTNDRSVEFIIDLDRTLASTPPQDATCRICRTNPGAVCCGDGSLVSLQYLESGSGRIMQMDYEPSIRVMTLEPVPGESRHPSAISVKNVGAPSTVYGATSFKLPFRPASPALDVIDTAQDDSGRNYFLTVLGNMVRDDGTVLNLDPKIVSLSYQSGQWYLLRSDGAILSGSDLSSASTFQETGAILKTASKLISGRGTYDNF